MKLKKIHLNALQADENRKDEPVRPLPNPSAPCHISRMAMTRGGGEWRT
jgi:hypothetical protein